MNEDKETHFYFVKTINKYMNKFYFAPNPIYFLPPHIVILGSYIYIYIYIYIYNIEKLRKVI